MDLNDKIQVNHISKVFKMYDSPMDKMKEAFSISGKIRHIDFYAITDLSFHVKKGEILGIMGRNGSGKSTLLKMITGIYEPTSGSITISGKVSSLLELGTGFNMEYSGIENIFFYGTLMGFTRGQMEEKLQDIIDFAEIGDYVYQPVKTYSSGMFARLAFSCAINVEPDILIVDYKDDATAFNGEKKGTIEGKGGINNQMTNQVFQMLEKEGVPTHFVEQLSQRETAVKKVEIVPLEVIVRNVAAGCFSKRLGVEEGTPFTSPTLEFSYKNDDLGDPLINDYFAIALNLATREEIEIISKYAFQVNETLKKYFLQADIELIDFKIEFGRYHGTIILADEISPDTCRLWDVHTHEKLDKDRFRRDLGNVEEAYNEVFKRLGL